MSVSFNETISVKIIHHWRDAHRLARINTEWRMEQQHRQDRHRFQRKIKNEIEEIIVPILLKKIQIIQQLDRKVNNQMFQEKIIRCEEVLRPIVFQKHINFMEFLMKDILIQKIGEAMLNIYHP